jgi:hypothetical protein
VGKEKKPDGWATWLPETLLPLQQKGANQWSVYIITPNHPKKKFTFLRKQFKL